MPQILSNTLAPHIYRNPQHIHQSPLFPSEIPFPAYQTLFFLIVLHHPRIILQSLQLKHSNQNIHKTIPCPFIEHFITRK